MTDACDATTIHNFGSVLFQILTILQLQRRIHLLLWQDREFGSEYPPQSQLVLTLMVQVQLSRELASVDLLLSVFQFANKSPPKAL